MLKQATLASIYQNYWFRPFTCKYISPLLCHSVIGCEVSLDCISHSPTVSRGFKTTSSFTAERKSAYLGEKLQIPPHCLFLSVKSELLYDLRMNEGLPVESHLDDCTFKFSA